MRQDTRLTTCLKTTTFTLWLQELLSEPTIIWTVSGSDKKRGKLRKETQKVCFCRSTNQQFFFVCVYLNTRCSVFFSLWHINTEKVNGVSGLSFPQMKELYVSKNADEIERMKSYAHNENNTTESQNDSALLTKLFVFLRIEPCLCEGWITGSDIVTMFWYEKNMKSHYDYCYNKQGWTS